MNIRFKILLFLCLTINQQIPANYYLIDGQYEDNSVIKLWFTVLGLLDQYDKNKSAGFMIDFDQHGKHFTPESGPNWWSYYFAFNSVGFNTSHQVMRVPRYQRSMIRFETVCTMSPARANFLLNKYMHLRANIQDKLIALKTKYYANENPVIGVYYQNPMMSDVQKSWTPEELITRVKQELPAISSCKVCLFTENAGFLEKFGQELSSRLIHITELVNTKNSTPAERGEHELLRLLLLAQCDIVIAPGCYQGIGAKMLNPNLRLIELDTIPYARE